MQVCICVYVHEIYTLLPFAKKAKLKCLWVCAVHKSEEQHKKKLTNQQVNCLWVMTNGFNESHYIAVVCECVAYLIIYYLADWVFSLFLKLNTKAFFILYKLLLFDCNCNEINKNRYCERELICLDRMDKHKFHYIQLKLIGLSLYTSFSVTLVCTIYLKVNTEPLLMNLIALPNI